MADDELDRLTSGVVLLNARGQVVRCNLVAITMLAQHDGLMLTADALHAASPRHNRVLQAMLKQAVDPGGSDFQGTNGSLHIERPSRQPAWNVAVVPLPHHMSPAWHPDAVAAVFVSEVNPNRRPAPDAGPLTT